MSYGIVRIEKYKAEDVRGIEYHDKRTRPSKSNPDIKHEKTTENYTLIPCEGSYSKAIKQRLSKLSSTKAVRKDAVVLVQFLVTSDTSFFENMSLEKEKAFFLQSLDFLLARYGQENFFSAVVHRDERTPHMAVSMTPIRDGRLTAKEIFSRKELTALHTDFHRSVGQHWGLQRGESREEKRKHLSVADFKAKTQLEAAQHLAQEAQRLEQEATARIARIDAEVDEAKQRKLEAANKDINEQIGVLEANHKFFADNLEKQFQEKIDSLEKLNTSIEDASNNLQDIQSKVKEEADKFSSLQDDNNKELETLKQNHSTEKENLEKAIETAKIALQDEISSKNAASELRNSYEVQANKAALELERLQGEMQKLHGKITAAEKSLSDIEGAKPVSAWMAVGRICKSLADTYPKIWHYDFSMIAGFLRTMFTPDEQTYILGGALVQDAQTIKAAWAEQDSGKEAPIEEQREPEPSQDMTM